jgi:hypothetical protein
MLAGMRATPILRLALFAEIALAILRAVLMFMPMTASFESCWLAISATTLPLWIAVCVGTFELASRLTGGGRKAALVAAYAMALGLANNLVESVVRITLYQPLGHSLTAATVLAVVSFVSFLVATIGFGVAAWCGGNDRRHRVATIVAVVIALGTYVAFIVAPMFVESDNGLGALHMRGLINNLITITRAITAVALVLLARPSIETAPSPRLAARGMRLIAGALWWRLAAIVAGAYGALRIAAVFDSDSARRFQIAIIGQATIEMVMFAVFATGALVFVRGAPAGAPRRAFLIAGLGAGWCAGVMSVKVPYLYLFSSGSLSSIDIDTLSSLTIGEPIVAIAAIATVVFALRGISGLASLADSASARGLGFVIMMLVSLAIASIDTPREAALGVVAFGAVFSVSAIVLVARVLSRAARMLDNEQPSLPTATALTAPAP